MRVIGRLAVRSLLVATTALSVEVALTDAANAAITVVQATASNGTLKLRGTATPNSVITLDGGIARTTARSTGSFDFGLLY